MEAANCESLADSTKCTRVDLLNRRNCRRLIPKTRDASPSLPTRRRGRHQLTFGLCVKDVPRGGRSTWVGPGNSHRILSYQASGLAVKAPSAKVRFGLPASALWSGVATFDRAGGSLTPEARDWRGGAESPLARQTPLFSSLLLQPSFPGALCITLWGRYITPVFVACQ